VTPSGLRQALYVLLIPLTDGVTHLAKVAVTLSCDIMAYVLFKKPNPIIQYFVL